MNIKKINNNSMEMTKDNGTRVLVSYSTPVACYLDAPIEFNSKPLAVGYYRTEKKHSNTTSKHINQWLGFHGAVEMPQCFFNGLI